VQSVLHIELPEENNRLSVYDMVGNRVFEGSIPGVYNFDMSILKAGLYFLKIKNTKGIKIIKVVKR
jgi:hypothetical protein